MEEYTKKLKVLEDKNEFLSQIVVKMKQNQYSDRFQLCQTHQQILMLQSEIKSIDDDLKKMDKQLDNFSDTTTQ